MEQAIVTLPTACGGAVVPLATPARAALQLWASRTGLGEEVRSLMTVVDEVNRVLVAAEPCEATVQGSLGKYLKDLDRRHRDAERLLEELDYYRRIQEELQDPDDQLVSSITDGVGNLSSFAPEENLDISSSSIDPDVSYNSTADSFASFSTICQLVTCNASRSTNLVACAKDDITLIWERFNKDTILSTIADHVMKLNTMRKSVCEIRELEDTSESGDSVINSILTINRSTGPCVTEAKVYGRDKEINQIVHKLTSGESSKENISVLALVGHGGIGKTTLAQEVFNDPKIALFFDRTIWIYVSVYFDEVKLTRQLLEWTCKSRYEHVQELNHLQKIVKDAIKSERLLLVMDDVWEDEDKSRWDTFLAPLLCNAVNGSKILVTTRKFSVLRMINATDCITVSGLDEVDIWCLFKKCAVGDSKPKELPALLKIGSKLVEEFRGYPLAAKSVGALLNKRLDPVYWKRVQESGEWKDQSNDGILPALKISYKFLPSQLQRCFSYCGLFPKNYRYDSEQLVNMWIAQGQRFVGSTVEDKRMEEIGSGYFHVLVEHGFFRKEPQGIFYLMHDLVHDLAEMVSAGECIKFDGECIKYDGVEQQFRHISVITEAAYHIELNETVERNGQFEGKFVKTSRALQGEASETLLLIGRYDSSFSSRFQEKFNDMKALRVLKLEMISHNLNSLICNISALIHLRYLELTPAYPSTLLKLPEALCKLWHLEVLDIRSFRPFIGFDIDIPKGINKLVNLRHFIAREELHEKISEVGNMTLLQELKAFRVSKEEGFEIGQLSKLNALRGSLSIYSLDHVQTKEEATKARLQDKMHLRKLYLSWDNSDHSPVLEGLEPHSSLQALQISKYSCSLPTWLHGALSLKSLQSLHLEGCRKWKHLPPMDKFPVLKELHLIRLNKVVKLLIPSLEVLEVREMPRLAKCRMLDKNQLSTNLRRLQIADCHSLVELPFFVCSDGIQIEQQFPHLCQLEISDLTGRFALLPLPITSTCTDVKYRSAGATGITFDLSVGPYDLLSLEIDVSGSPKILDKSVLAFDQLQTLGYIEIRNFEDIWWEGFQDFKCLKSLKICSCPKLFSSLVIPKEKDAKYILLPSLQKLELANCNITGHQLSWLLSGLPFLTCLTIRHCEQIRSLSVAELHTEDSTASENSWHIPSQCLSTLHKLEIECCQTRTEDSYIIFLSNKGLGEFIHVQEIVIKSCPKLLSTMVSEAVSDTCSILPSSLLKLQITDMPDQLMRQSELPLLIELDLSQCDSLRTLCLFSCSALQELTIKDCQILESLQCLQKLQLLEALTILTCPSLESLELDGCTKLRELRVENCTAIRGLKCATSLTELNMSGCTSLTFLALDSCTALSKLMIRKCSSLVSWQGLQSLTHLKHLEVFESPGFASSWNSAAEELKREGLLFSLQLEKLFIDDVNVLIVLICKMLPSLKILHIDQVGQPIRPAFHIESFTAEQEGALLGLGSLEELGFIYMRHLKSFPVELCCLSSLKKLCVRSCPNIRFLPQKGLPDSLKYLDVEKCDRGLSEHCKEWNRSGRCTLYIDGRKF